MFLLADLKSAIIFFRIANPKGRGTPHKEFMPQGKATIG